MKMALLTVSLMVGLALAQNEAAGDSEAPAEIQYSDLQTISYTNESEGNMTFTYKTYLKGSPGLEEAWINAKIVIDDDKFFDTQMLEF